MTIPNGYIAIAGDWSYAPTRVGKVLRAPDGEQVYFQPGDDESEFMAQVEAIQEWPEDRQWIAADIVLGEYFA